jgi:hypothetical protein
VDAFYRQDQPLFPLSDRIVEDNKIEIIQPSAEDAAALQKAQAGMKDAWAAGD